MTRRIRHWLRERYGLSWHGQNLNGAWESRATGPMWQHGRGWLRWWGCPETDLTRGARRAGRHRPLLDLHAEWLFLTRQAHALAFGVTVGEGDGNDGLLLHVSVPFLASLYFGVEGIKAFHQPGWDGARRIEVRLELQRNCGGPLSLWWSLWHSTMSWDSRTPRWRHGSFDVVDFVLGRPKYDTTMLEECTTLVPMPERAYPARVKLFLATWRRPRWPFPTRLRCATVEVEGGIPHPGKGESGYDCGDDATFSLTCPARTVAEAIGRMVGSVTESRHRYGGLNWMPAVGRR